MKYRIVFFALALILFFVSAGLASAQDIGLSVGVDSLNTIENNNPVEIGPTSVDNEISAVMEQGQSNLNVLDFGSDGPNENLVNLGGRLSLESFQPPRTIYIPEDSGRKFWYEQPVFHQDDLLCLEQVETWLKNNPVIVQKSPLPPKRFPAYDGPVRTMYHLPKTGRRAWSYMLITPANAYPYVPVVVGVSGMFRLTNADTVAIIIREMVFGQNAGNFFKPGGNLGGIDNLLSWGASGAYQTGQGEATAFPWYRIEFIGYRGVNPAEIYPGLPQRARMDLDYAGRGNARPSSPEDAGQKDKARFVGFANGRLDLSEPHQEQAIAYNVALLEKNWGHINRVQFFAQGLGEEYAREVRLETGARLYENGVPEEEIISKFGPDSSKPPSPQLEKELEKRNYRGVVGVTFD